MNSSHRGALPRRTHERAGGADDHEQIGDQQRERAERGAQKNASDPEARKPTRIARYPMIVASRTQTAASRGVPLADDTRAIGLDGNKSLDSAKRMREAATIDANAPPKAEQMASPSNRSAGPAAEIARRQIRQQRRRRGEAREAGPIGAEPQRLGGRHERENDSGAEDGPDQHAGDREPRLRDFLAQASRPARSPRRTAVRTRVPMAMAEAPTPAAGIEQIRQRGIVLRSMSLRHQQQHRASHQHHGNDGNAFENDQHQAGAPRRNNAQRRQHHGGQHRQAEAGRIAPEIKALQEVGAEQTGTADSKGSPKPTASRPSSSISRTIRFSSAT